MNQALWAVHGGEWHLQLDLESVLRLAVSLTNAYGALALARALAHLPSPYRPHMLFCIVWSLTTSVAMLVLALHCPVVWAIPVLNVSALFMVGGWSTLLARITRDIRDFNERHDVRP